MLIYSETVISMTFDIIFIIHFSTALFTNNLGHFKKEPKEVCFISIPEQDLM